MASVSAPLCLAPLEDACK